MKEEHIVVSEKKAGGLEVCIDPEKKGLIIEIIGENEKKLQKLKKKHTRKEIEDIEPKKVVKDKIESVKAITSEADEKLDRRAIIEPIEDKEKLHKKVKKENQREKSEPI